MWKCRWKFVGEKCEHFFRLNVCIGFRVSSTFGQSDGCMSASRKTICRTFLCVPYGTSEQKHNRAKPMSELPSALFLIADGNEFRFARFYNVCEEVPLGTPESPPIVSGVSDMHPSDCPNVEEPRNPMQTFSRKKFSHFSQTNIPSAFSSEIPRCVVFP